MPHVVCPRCRRANPNEAVFCHFDGAELRAAAGQPRVPNNHLPHPFVFPSGRNCNTYDELSKACQEEWAESRSLLQKGVFAQFLSSSGRLDLVQAAQKAQAHADQDIGLHFFINSLPATQMEGPRLDLQPRRLVLGTVFTGETRQVGLNIYNRGKGLLHGTLTIASGNEWLRVAGNNGDSQCSLKTAREQQVTLHVDTRGLAAPQTYTAKLTVITNGGIVEVPVSLDVDAYPFPKAPFQDVFSPRQMAEQMRKQPKAAVTLLENGEVQRWFTANGWTYPVSGPTAPGVAAVQQFFEAMGLSKPPALQLSDDEVHLFCMYPETVPGKVVLRTGTKKWVYAQCETDATWLRVTTPSISGPQQAVIEFEVDSSMLDANRVHTATINVTANAGQTLAFLVHADVRKPHEPFTRRLLRPFFPGLILALVFRLLVAAPADLQARVLTSPEPGAGSFPTWLPSPIATPQSAEHYLRQFVLTTWWVGAVAGLVLLWRRRGRWADLFFGTVAGAVAGVSGGASTACVLATIDGLPRLVWRGLDGVVGGSQLAGSVWLCTAVWILLAAACWAALGALAGFLLGALGPTGRGCLAHATAPLAWICGLIGMRRAASLLTLQ